MSAVGDHRFAQGSSLEDGVVVDGVFFSDSPHAEVRKPAMSCRPAPPPRSHQEPDTPLAAEARLALSSTRALVLCESRKGGHERRGAVSTSTSFKAFMRKSYAKLLVGVLLHSECPTWPEVELTHEQANQSILETRLEPGWSSGSRGCLLRRWCSHLRRPYSSWVSSSSSASGWGLVTTDWKGLRAAGPRVSTSALEHTDLYP